MSKSKITRAEQKHKEWEELQERKRKEMEEIEQQLKGALNFDAIKVISIKEYGEEYDLKVDLEFTLDGYTQADFFYWRSNESSEQFVAKVKKLIDYIKELRQKYPDFCKQNDFIQTHSEFKRILELTHMGYKRKFTIDLKLADYMKMPNTTSTGCGGGDYEIKRTPKRVDEYNANIDEAINFFIDCIAELKGMKCIPKEKELRGEPWRKQK